MDEVRWGPRMSLREIEGKQERKQERKEESMMMIQGAYIYLFNKGYDMNGF